MPTVNYAINGWRAWYTEDRTFDSETTDWVDLPETGALYFRLYYQTRPYGRYVSGGDYYWCQQTPEGDIYAYGIGDHAIIPQECWDENLVKLGQWVTDAEMAAIHQAVIEAVDSPDEEGRDDAE